MQLLSKKIAFMWFNCIFLITEPILKCVSQRARRDSIFFMDCVNLLASKFCVVSFLFRTVKDRTSRILRFTVEMHNKNNTLYNYYTYGVKDKSEIVTLHVHYNEKCGSIILLVIRNLQLLPYLRNKLTNARNISSNCF